MIETNIKVNENLSKGELNSLSGYLSHNEGRVDRPSHRIGFQSHDAQNSFSLQLNCEKPYGTHIYTRYTRIIFYTITTYISYICHVITTFIILLITCSIISMYSFLSIWYYHYMIGDWTMIYFYIYNIFFYHNHYLFL